MVDRMVRTSTDDRLHAGGRVANDRGAVTPRQLVAARARREGLDVEVILELFDERAAIREYCGEMPRYQAEAAAVQDVIAGVSRPG